MIERSLELPTADGPMTTFVVHPEEGGPFPVVLFYMDAPGKREELHEMARRIASVGYLVALPNLYHRTSRDYVLRERTEAGFAEMFGHMHSLDRRTTHCDTAALLAFVDAEPRADAARIGALGYCMSGPFVIWAAVDFAERLACIASIYGAGLVTAHADSPHRQVAQIRCEAYFACAEIDKYAPPDDVAVFHAALAESAAPHRLEWYPGAQHGFAFPLRAGIYDKPSAERHWERLFALWRRCLGTPG